MIDPFSSFLYRTFHDLFRLSIVVILLLPGVACVRDDQNRTSYIGEISAEKNQYFFQHNRDRNITHLYITSSGGSVDAAIDLAYWVYRNNISVTVVDHCFSACANYVFPAAKRKIIQHGAIVAWHGNYHHLMTTNGWEDDVKHRVKKKGMDRSKATAAVLNQVRYLVDREKQFYGDIGINQYICWIGKMPPYSVPNYYFLSLEDMQRFGLKNISVPAHYSQTSTDRFDQSIQFVSLTQPAVPIDP